MSESMEDTWKLGLNEYESKAYITLLRFGSATASTISKVSQIPRARVYDVLTSLEKKSFIERKLSKPVEYTALVPSTVVKNTEKLRRRLFEEEIKEILTIGESLEKHVSKNSFGSNYNDEVRIIVGKENIYSKISVELENTNESVIFSTTSNGIKRKKDQFKHQIESLSNKGIKVNFKESDMRYCIIDKKTIFLFLSPDSEKKEDESALLIRNPFLATQFLKNKQS